MFQERIINHPNNFERPKNVAIYILNALGVSELYVSNFEANDNVYLHDREQITLITVDSELYHRIKQLEARTDVKVYAVTHDRLLGTGDLYSFLCINPYPEDWGGMLRDQPRSLYKVSAYVWNVAREEYSEFGYIFINVDHGKIVRLC